QLVGKYLALEEVRFQDRMRVEQQIDPQAREALVPTLILQPLVENAVRHGIAGRRSAGHIQIRARVEDGIQGGGRLILEVLDDGPGPPPDSSSQGRGVGLSNTRARLSELFGSDARLQLASRDSGGASARIELPLRRRKGAASP
ncbi:MAG: ATP-binding protein, partial [Acidobacteriota bacterium]